MLKPLFVLVPENAVNSLALLSLTWTVPPRLHSSQIVTYESKLVKEERTSDKPQIQTKNKTELKREYHVISFILFFLFHQGLPALNFAYHCETPVSPEYPFLLRCPKIEEGIKECQKRGKKVLMSLGGATGDGTLPSPDRAKEFAHTLYNLFLGGKEKYQDIRPFGR